MLNSKYYKILLVGSIAILIYLKLLSIKLESNTTSAVVLVGNNDDNDEEIYWRFDKRIRTILENLIHRSDYIRHELTDYNQQMGLAGQLSALNARLVDAKHAAVKNCRLISRRLRSALMFNRFKPVKLAKLSANILSRVNRIQNTKCSINKVIVCSLEDNCGYACLFHHLSICFILSYYMDRTVVISKTLKKGIQDFNKYFLPITNSCQFNHESILDIRRQATRPIELLKQYSNGKHSYDRFIKDLGELSKYHSEPYAFFVGQLMSYIMRYDRNSDFYKTVKEAKSKFNITGPYAAIHIRRSDKFDEALFYGTGSYMEQVEQFYDEYFQDNPDKINSTERLVYVASDEGYIIDGIKSEYKNKYRFIYNTTFSHLTGSQSTRYSLGGFESLLFDLYFLSHADYLVCTFSSNICRLAYEFMLTAKSGDDRAEIVKSLDVPYFHVSDANLYKIAVLNRGNKRLRTSEADIRKGDLFHRLVSSGLRYYEYKSDGYFYGCNSRTGECTDFDSFKLKNFY